MALLVTLVGMSLTATLVPMVMTQITGTRVVSARTESLDAAQAGLDAALGQLRAATSAPKVGLLEALPPCTMNGSLDGSELRYRVKIVYYGLPENSEDATPEKLGCPPLDVPTSATLTSTGTGTPTGSVDAGAAGTRTVEATYKFKTNNENITGGTIPLASPTTNPLCMDGGADQSPANGTAVRMQLCTGNSDQRFAYTTDLAIKMIGSETGTAPAGMCLDSPLPHKTDAAVTFQPCLGRTARQQWSLDNSSNFRGTPDGVALDNFCINLKSRGLAGSVLVLGGCGTTFDQNVFRPQPAAGAGMASADTGQVVNYKQFSRCLDVTNHNKDMKETDYMIVWYCKQAPDGAVSWNQRWTFPTVPAGAVKSTPERIRTKSTNADESLCLRTPLTTAAYVTAVRCPAYPTAISDERMKWTIYGDTGTYATSYRIMDSNGNCLTPTDLTVANPEVHGDGTAKVRVARCTGSELQKWNAPANLSQPLTLTDTKEK